MHETAKMYWSAAEASLLGEFASLANISIAHVLLACTD